MKNKLIVLSALLSKSLCADLPADWLASAQTLVTSSAGMKEALSSDIATYQAEKSRISALSSLLVSASNLRVDTMACARAKFISLSQEVQQCQDDTQLLINEGQLRVDGLKAELLGLKASTDLQIHNLIEQKHSLEAQFDSWKRHLAEDLGEYGDQGRLVLSKLNDLAVVFDAAVLEREEFSVKVSDLLKQLEDVAKAALADVYDIKHDLCDNTTAIKEMPKYTPMTYEPIECPNQEYLDEEGSL